MKRTLLALGLALALLGGACGSDDEPTVGGSGDDTTETTAKEGPPEFEAGTSMKAFQDKGKVVVGTKFDQPGFGLKNPTTGEVEGFDVEIAKLIGEAIFGPGGEEKVEFTEAVTKNREPYIQNGTVDLVVATYTINDARKQSVDFAGPYFIARQDLMVKSDNTTIKSVKDLDGKKVCTAKGSTSEKNVRAQAPGAQVVLFDNYSLCATELENGRVDAVTTDDTILAGLVSNNVAKAFKLVDAPFSTEDYGIGLKKGDDELRGFLNDTLEEIFDNGEWKKALEATLGKLGLKTPKPPAVDRYESGAAAPAGGTSTSAPGTSAPSTTTKP